jgi:hypothetical protein
LRTGRAAAGELEHIHYFRGNTEIAEDLIEREPRRVALYQGVAGLMRSFANITDELDAAGYSSTLRSWAAGSSNPSEYRHFGLPFRRSL